jgi:hypothetical protein
LVHRLSIDGVTNIVSGMIDWFRDLSISNPGAKIWGYDPYLNHYVLSVGEEPIRVYNAIAVTLLLSQNKLLLLVMI